MYEFECKNCGKKHTELHAKGPRKMFCDRKCWSEYRKKEKTPTPAKTPEEQCVKCLYSHVYGKICGCGYYSIMGHTRHSLHPEGLPDECQEYEPKTPKRTRSRKIN